MTPFVNEQANFKVINGQDEGKNVMPLIFFPDDRITLNDLDLFKLIDIDKIIINCSSD